MGSGTQLTVEAEYGEECEGDVRDVKNNKKGQKRKTEENFHSQVGAGGNQHGKS